MKLRNKKTGEIGNLIGTERSCPYITIDIDFHDGNPIAFDYTSLTELNEDWEDYEPAEPLIKDEKIRKAVRAWAEAIGATKNIVFDGSKKLYSFYYENNKGGFEKLLIYGDNDLEELKRYTIAELCGEEEE